MVGTTLIIIMATITTIVDFRAVLAGPLAKRDGRKNNRRPIGACSVSAVNFRFNGFILRDAAMRPLLWMR